MKQTNWVALAAAVGTLVFIGTLLMHYGYYGFGLFVLLPCISGAIAVNLTSPRSGLQAAAIGGFKALAGCFLFLALGVEGLFCVLLSIPLAVPLGALGGFLAYRSPEPKTATRMLCLLFLPASGWDIFATPPVRPVTTSVVIQAPPQVVWKHVLSFPDLPEPTEWYFRAGLAYPQRARIENGVRYCQFSTGDFVEPITVRDEPRLLAFRVTENPPPMRELSPYGEIDAKHLHHYMESERGQFLLESISGGKATRLVGTTWYRHGLWPDLYWRLWSDAIIHRIHLRVLHHIRGLSEKEQR